MRQKLGVGPGAPARSRAGDPGRAVGGLDPSCSTPSTPSWRPARAGADGGSSLPCPVRGRAPVRRVAIHPRWSPHGPPRPSRSCWPQAPSGDAAVAWRRATRRPCGPGGCPRRRAIGDRDAVRRRLGVRARHRVAQLETDHRASQPEEAFLEYYATAGEPHELAHLQADHALAGVGSSWSCWPLRLGAADPDHVQRLQRRHPRAGHSGAIPRSCSASDRARSSRCPAPSPWACSTPSPCLSCHLRRRASSTAIAGERAAARSRCSWLPDPRARRCTSRSWPPCVRSPGPGRDPGRDGRRIGDAGLAGEIDLAQMPLVVLNGFGLWAAFTTFGLAASVSFDRPGRPSA